MQSCASMNQTFTRQLPCRFPFGTGVYRQRCRSGFQTKRPSRSSGVVQASNDAKPFGYTRKDAVIIGVGLIGGGYALKAGLEASGVDEIQSGVYAQLAVFLFLCFGWVGSYIFRVATKQMTYVQQLQQYEDAVMKKRLEEMTEEEVKALTEELEKDKQGRQA